MCTRSAMLERLAARLAFTFSQREMKYVAAFLLALFSLNAQAVPSWVTALSVGQWYEIPNTSISSVDPSPTPPGVEGPVAKINDWTSFVVDTRSSKLYSVASGGHNGYGGNEVDVLTLDTETPSWSQVLAPTPNASIIDGAYYSDGRPSSRHQYYGVVLDTFDDRFMLFTGSHYSSGSFTSKTDSYNIAGNSYNVASTHPDIPSPLAGDITSVGGLPSVTVDPATGNVYLSVIGDSAVWTRSTNAWTLLSSGGADGFYSMSAFDTLRNRVFVVSTVDHHLYTLGNSTWSTVTITGANAANVTIRQGSMFYVPVLDVFLVRDINAGGTVYQINASTFVATTFSTSGGGAIPVHGNGNGPFNKFIYVPNLGGFVYTPTYAGNAWFLKTNTIAGPTQYLPFRTN